MSKLWDFVIENLSSAELQQLQFTKLKAQLIRVYDQSPYYRDKFDKAGVNPHQFNHIEQYNKYPFFDKDEEQESQARSTAELGHPLGMHIICIIKDVRRISSSSGATGTPTFSGFTQQDREVTIENIARLMARVGIEKGDPVMHAGVLSI